MSNIQPEELEHAVIRQGSTADAEKVLRLFQAHLNWINVWYEDQSVVQRRDAANLGLQTHLLSGYPSAVADIDGRIVGFCVTEIRELGVLEVRNIYVDDPYRNAGIGTTMLREVERQAAAREINAIVAFSNDKYYKGKRFPTRAFKSVGYDAQRLGSSIEMYTKVLEQEALAFSSYAVTPTAGNIIRINPTT